MMVSKKIGGIIILLLSFLAIPTHANANWYSGSEFDPSNGIRAYITAYVLTGAFQGGESNWVSTFNFDINGTDWIQTGWRYYENYVSGPKQYVEWCIDCTPNGGTYQMHDGFANHQWGTTVHYQIKYENDQGWCAYTTGFLRFCVQGVHPAPSIILAKSEIHFSPLNPLNTDFNSVQYFDQSNNSWVDFDNRVYWDEDFPYSVEIFNNSHFRTFRVNTIEVFLPIVVR